MTSIRRNVSVVVGCILLTGCVVAPFDGQEFPWYTGFSVWGFVLGPEHHVVVEAEEWYGGWTEIGSTASASWPLLPAGTFGDSPDLYHFEIPTLSNWAPSGPENWGGGVTIRVRDLTDGYAVVGGTADSLDCFLAGSNSVPFVDRAVGCGYSLTEVRLCAEGWAPCP